MVALAQSSNEPRPGNGRTGNLNVANSIQQAVEVQRILWQALKKPNVKPALLAGLARAWCDVNEERRKLRMQPLPKSVDVSKLPRRGRKAQAQAAEPSEPGQTPQPVVS